MGTGDGTGVVGTGEGADVGTGLGTGVGAHVYVSGKVSQHGVPTAFNRCLKVHFYFVPGMMVTRWSVAGLTGQVDRTPANRRQFWAWVFFSNVETWWTCKVDMPHFACPTVWKGRALLGAALYPQTFLSGHSPCAGMALGGAPSHKRLRLGFAPNAEVALDATRINGHTCVWGLHSGWKCNRATPRENVS